MSTLTMQPPRRLSRRPRPAAPILLVGLALALPGLAAGQAEAPKGPPGEAKAPSSYDQVTPALLGQKSFEAMMAKDKADKPAVMERQRKLLEERYDLTPRPDPKVRMTRGKPIPVGPTARLPEGMTWEKLAEMSPDEIREQGLFPKGFLPLPHPKHEVGGMVFPQMEIKQLARLERFDLDFDLPEHFLPEFPPAIFLTTRPDLGDVSQGKLVTVENFQEIFQGILNAEGSGGDAAAGDAVPAAAVQRHGRPQDGAARGHAGRGLLRLPRQRPHLGGDAPGRRHPAAVAPPPHRHAEPARREHPAAVRLAAGAEDASRTSPSSSSGPPTSTATRSRRRPRGSTRWSAAARSTSWPRCRTCSTSRRPRAGSVRQARPEEVRGRLAGDARPEAVLRQGPAAPSATRRRTTPTTRCTT